MIFAAPLALLGLLALPALVLLLRLNPPPPRRLRFPPLALLCDLPAPRQTANRIPLWLLILRLAAAALVCLGLARPTLHPPAALPGSGPVLLVIDNGWAAAADWPARRAAAQRLIAAAAWSHRPVDLLATAPDANGAAPRLTGLLTATAAAEAVQALQPQPWPPDRAAASIALANAPRATRIYIADGLTDGPGFPRFLKILAPDRILAAAAPPLLLSVRLTAGRGLAVRGANLPPGSVLSAHTAGGAVIARTGFSPTGDALITLPPQLANQISSLTLDGPPSAAGTLLLDAASRTVITGLAAGAGSAEEPYLGALYFLRRALPPNAQVIPGDFLSLINAHPGLIILADLPLDPSQAAAARRYVAAGGVLVRFAGPISAATPDDLSADPLLPGDRRLGGALTWTVPQSLAAFPATSPFLGLPPDSAVRTTRQILADPTRLDPTTVWASLQDGTPLVLGAAIGKGVLVNVLTSASTDWSTLALSGLYPAMLAHLTALATGAGSKPAAALPLRAQLTAYGGLVAPSNPAALSASLASVIVSPAQPAGLYGDGTSLALNLGDHVPFPVAASLPNPAPLIGAPPPADLGAFCIAAALLLLAADLLLSLHRRGAITLRRIAVLALLLSPGLGHAQSAALQTSLGYIRTGDPMTDQISADGLDSLSAEVSTHTSAALGAPVALDPATDSLNLYPLIYWPLRAASAPPGQPACAALNDYMHHGGLLIIDTQGGDVSGAGSGAGFAPGAGAALARATACLDLPPLQPLTGTDVLAHCFYILHDFPGRFAGASTLVAAPAARDADGVSPVIIGADDWAGAWAYDDTGVPEQLPIPGGEDQRLLADRFGTNLVIYALTGSYKADQSNLTALLGRLGP